MIHPLGDRVVVKPTELKEKTASGLFIPGTRRDSSNEGIVVAIGPDVTQVKAGDRVLFLRWASYSITHNGEQLTSVEIGSVLCVVDADDVVKFEAVEK